MKLQKKQLMYMKNFENFAGLETDKSEDRSYYIIANITFFLYLFFVFFGTALPFRKSMQEMDEIPTSNIVNQIVYSILFLSSLYALIPRWRSVILLIEREKIFFLFLTWCALTLLWSNYSLVSFKRFFQYVTTYTVFLAVLTNIESVDDTFKHFKILLSIYILLSFISVLTIPGAKDGYGLWRGLAPSKNNLGQMSLIAILFFVYFVIFSSFKQKIFFSILLLMALTLFIGSRSVTSLLTLLLILGLLVAQYIDKQFVSTGIGKTVSTLTIIFAFALFASLLFLAPGLLSGVVGETGRDLTLTGRTDLWQDVFQLAKTHLILGCGFQGFWVLDSLQIQELYLVYIWIPIQAHNGYLDILNETGLIGLFLFILTAINFFLNLRKIKTVFFWKWIVIAVLFTNITESTLIRPNIASGILYTFSYLALFQKLNSTGNYNEELE